jgi:thioesterase domain-containing protein
MALQLSREGEQIDKLIVLDSEAPLMQGGFKRRFSRVATLMELVKLYELSINQSLNLRENNFVELSNEDQLDLLLSRLIEVKIMPPRTSIEALRGIVRVFETNINTKYIPEDRYCGQLNLIGVEQIEENVNNFDYCQGYISKWKGHASSINFWQASGNHITVLNFPYVSELAGWIKTLLN